MLLKKGFGCPALNLASGSIRHLHLAMTIGNISRLCIGLALLLAPWPALAQVEVQTALARGCFFAYYPAQNLLSVRCDFSLATVGLPAAAEVGKACAQVQIRLTPHDGGPTLAQATVLLLDGRSEATNIEVPRLAGNYAIAFAPQGLPDPLTVVKYFTRQTFPWEGNTLGVTDEVFPPFTPVQVDGRRVSVVARQYLMNGFGLWDAVTAQGHDLLAAPITLRCITADEETPWSGQTVSLLRRSDNLAVFAGEASSDAVRVKTVSSIAVDGCMKVEMTLLPGAHPREIRKLWLDIPLNAAEVPLFHEVVDHPALGYAGALPAGEGVIWDSTQARRYSGWRNSFCPYLWLGADERGLAWFAENDNGWITEKAGSTRPLQEIVRTGNCVIVHVLLINRPVTLTGEHRLVFGLQASPTKPLPPDWRARARVTPSAADPALPPGGLHAAYQGPFHDDWSIIDHLYPADGKADPAWFTQYAREHNPPPVSGTWPWLDSALWFAAQPRPALIYQEELAASRLRDGWQTFQDEWRCAPATTRDTEHMDESILRLGYAVDPRERVNCAASYRDFGAWYANEWLKRGFGLYWDHTAPAVSTNPLTSAAYVTEDGGIQPALLIWNQRAYQQRVWNLLQFARRRGGHAEWAVETTDSVLLPLQSWATVQACLHNHATEPFSPEELRAVAGGRQTGCAVAWRDAPYGDRNPTPGSERSSWGMRMVHEALRAGEGGEDATVAGIDPALEQLVQRFGYGKPEVQVVNYWAEHPVLSVDAPAVKWLALIKPATHELLLVFASWSAEDVAATVTFSPADLGFAPGTQITDEETGEHSSVPTATGFRLDLPGPYGVRVVRVAGEK